MASSSKAAALPFMGVSEGIDLVKKVWGVTGLPMLPTPSSMAQFATRLPQTLPSMIAPTLDVEELDKRIADLRAVEQWLNLNLSMLRTTVQSLEVQRNTIATLKSFGGALLSAGAAHPAAAAPTENWPYPAGHSGAAMPRTATMPAPMPAPPPKARHKGRGSGAAAAAAAAALPLNPTVWWNTLQEQFTKIAATAAAEAQAAARAAEKAETRKAQARKEEEKPADAGPTAAPARKAVARKRKRRPLQAR